MSNESREAEQNSALCSFCQQEFGPVAKFMPNCGKLICIECYESLIEDLAESRMFGYQACGECHSVRDSG